MKNLLWPLYLVAALAGLTLFGRATSAFAAEDRGGPADRLERLERRVTEMAERQEQMMRRLGEQMEHRGAMPQRPPEDIRSPMPPAGHPVPVPAAAMFAKDIGGLVRLVILVGILCNILLAVWIFTDIRKRGEGSGIFIAMALVAGIPAALIYALTRLGDKKA